MPYNQTIGGLKGHLFRRCVHVAILIVPFIYYGYGLQLASFISLSPQLLLLIIMGITSGLEVLRLKQKWVVWGQRRGEANCISSFTWMILSLCIVMLLAPGKQYAIPLIASCAVVDPLLGELRRTSINRAVIFGVGSIVVMLVWVLAAWRFKVEWLLAPLMGFLVVMLEWPNFRWVDDNALMQLIPLLVILILYGCSPVV